MEYKKCDGSLARSFWESYSAFCNTKGGYIILGVEENIPKDNIIGVGNDDVSCITIDNKNIVIIKVNEAPDSQKPVYLNNNYKKSYIRTGDGDRLINDIEIKMFLRNSTPENDSLLIDKFTIDDLDENYRLYHLKIM